MKIDRFAVLGVLAVAVSAGGCTGGSTPAPIIFVTPTPTPTPIATPTASPNPSLLRFVQGSPDSGSAPGGAVDVCVDTSPLVAFPSFNYGRASQVALVTGSVTHTISVYPGISGVGAGTECATAPAAFGGNAPIKVATLTIGSSVRWTVVLGGTAASGTLGLYIFNEPTYAIVPVGSAAISHNAALAFTAANAPFGVGFGICTTTVTPCTTPVALTGAQNRPAPNASTTTSVLNGVVISGLNSVPAGFYDGVGVNAGTPVPITSITAPNVIAFQPYVVQLYAVDAPAGGLNLIALVEQTTGFGF